MDSSGIPFEATPSEQRTFELLEQRSDRRIQLSEIADGLSRPTQKVLPCKWLYDERGSQLFDQICALDVYYPTRTEQLILEQNAQEIARQCGPRAAIIEYGAGSAVKVRILLDALEDPVAVVPIDISGEHLAAACAGLARDYPEIEVKPVRADYSQPVPLPDFEREPRRQVAFFPGSTIGNFHRDKAAEFLSRIASTVGSGGALLIGVDIKKDREILEQAYDDPEGVTAEFNRNLLRHLNRALRTDFRVDRFAHRAVYQDDAGRVEMHLVSLEDQTVKVGKDEFTLDEGETIRTECSYKYSPDEFHSLARDAGFKVVGEWFDEDDLFGVYLLDVE
jgi:dimethylhistidine N-methyltransferase